MLDLDTEMRLMQELIDKLTEIIEDTGSTTDQVEAATALRTAAQNLLDALLTAKEQGIIG